MFGDIADLLESATDPIFSLTEVRRTIQTYIFSDDDRKAVTSALLSGLLQEMIVWQDRFEDEIEKRYGQPWSDQYEKIRNQVFLPWAAHLRAMEHADDKALMQHLRDLVHQARTYHRIRPAEP